MSKQKKKKSAELLICRFKKQTKNKQNKTKQNKTKPKEEHEQDKEIKQKGFLN